MRRGGGGRPPPNSGPRGGSYGRRKHYFDRPPPPPRSDDEDEEQNAARASRRRRLEALRAEVDNENDPRVTDAWHRMILEREELARAAQEAQSQNTSVASAEPAALEEDMESMDISDEESREGGASRNEASHQVPPQTAEQEVMTQLLGFTSFGTTKGQQHADTELSGVRKKTKRKYRQYMNRKGGFNRPLSPVF